MAVSAQVTPVPQSSSTINGVNLSSSTNHQTSPTPNHDTLQQLIEKSVSDLASLYPLAMKNKFGQSYTISLKTGQHLDLTINLVVGDEEKDYPLRRVQKVWQALSKNGVNESVRGLFISVLTIAESKGYDKFVEKSKEFDQGEAARKKNQKLKIQQAYDKANDDMKMPAVVKSKSSNKSANQPSNDDDMKMPAVVKSKSANTKNSLKSATGLADDENVQNKCTPKKAVLHNSTNTTPSKDGKSQPKKRVKKDTTKAPKKKRKVAVAVPPAEKLPDNDDDYLRGTFAEDVVPDGDILEAAREGNVVNSYFTRTEFGGEYHHTDDIESESDDSNDDDEDYSD